MRFYICKDGQNWFDPDDKPCEKATRFTLKDPDGRPDYHEYHYYIDIHTGSEMKEFMEEVDEFFFFHDDVFHSDERLYKMGFERSIFIFDKF